jgi:hypothetical protein
MKSAEAEKRIHRAEVRQKAPICSLAEEAEEVGMRSVLCSRHPE